MNKRQKKKLYKKLHGHNPPKVLEKPKPVQLIKPEPKPLDLSGLVAGARRFGQGLNEMADGIRQMARNVVKALTYYANNSTFRTMVDFAREHDERLLAQEKYEKMLVEEVPPYIKTAKILTAQRAAGKRRKRNYSKRRN